MAKGLKILETDKEIQKLVNQAISVELNKKIKNNYKKAEQRIRSAIPQWIGEQDEVKSLSSQGVPQSLNAQFGLPPSQAGDALNAIVNAISSTVLVNIKFLDKKLRGFIEFSIQPSNFSNLLGLPEGFVYTEPDLHWLNWLLTQGSSAIITGYQYEPGIGGRSGGGTMRGGQLWRVPTQFSGTVDDNFVTRALSNRDKELTNILSKVLE